jgi:hypothetical protein
LASYTSLSPTSCPTSKTIERGAISRTCELFFVVL